MHKKNEGTFSITVLGEKDIIIHTTKNSASYEKLGEQLFDSSGDVEPSKTTALAQEDTTPMMLSDHIDI